MVLHIFGYNFLNIQPIFNLQKVSESWDLEPSNHTIKYYVCWSMLEVSKVEITFDTSNIDSIWWHGWKALSLSFPKLFADWKLVEYLESYEQRCVRPFWASFNTFDIHSITALIGYIKLLLTPLTYPFISVSLYLFCLYNCTHINRMKPLPHYVHTVSASLSNSK